MSKQYVCNPETGQVIQVGGSIYRNVSKNAQWKRAMAQSPKSSSKERLKNGCKKHAGRQRQSPKRHGRATKTKDEEYNWKEFSESTEKRLRTASTQWIVSLTSEEREAIGWYVDSSVFINAAFRLDRPDKSEAEEAAWDAWSESYYHQTIRSHYKAFKTLQKMSKTHRFLQLSFPIMLYRVVPDYEKYCNYLKDLCIDSAPLSTSVTWKGAALIHESSTLIVIHAPPGTPLIPIYLVEGDETQKEVLLGPSTRLQFRKHLGVFSLPHFKTGELVPNVSVIEMEVV